MNNLMTNNIDDLKQLNNLPVELDSPKTDISIHDGVISAQRVAVKRNEAEIMRKIEILARVNGPRYYYSWEVNDKNSRTGKNKIEGGNITLAMDLARLYGNNQNDIRVTDNGDHWVFYARFVDLETGYSLTKAFQQRKSQSTFNTKDADRKLDIAFQIGQSKAQRNVILAALNTFRDFALVCSKSALFEKVSAKPKEFIEAIKNDVQELGFDISRVETNLGLASQKWDNTMIAKVWAEVQTIKDGVATFDDIYPSKKETVIDDKPKDLNALKEKFSAPAPVEVKSEPVKEDQKPSAPNIQVWIKLNKDIKAAINKAKTSDEVNTLINSTHKVTLSDMQKSQPDFYNEIMDYAMDKQASFHERGTKLSQTDLLNNN